MVEMDIRMSAADMRENHHVVTAFAKRPVKLGDRAASVSVPL